jgi:hypothetical protein
MRDEDRVVTRRTDEVVEVERPGYVPPATVGRVSETAYVSRAGGNTRLQRLVIFIFGLLQGLLLLRILLLLVAARESNGLVNAIYGISEVFVAPFRGILGRDEIAAGRSELDITAIVALVGWTILELIILGLIRVFRREP